MAVSLNKVSASYCCRDDSNFGSNSPSSLSLKRNGAEFLGTNLRLENRRKAVTFSRGQAGALIPRVQHSGEKNGDGHPQVEIEGDGDKKPPEKYSPPSPARCEGGGGSQEGPQSMGTQGPAGAIMTAGLEKDVVLIAHVTPSEASGSSLEVNHISLEPQSQDPLSLVEDGDIITVDTQSASLDVEPSGRKGPPIPPLALLEVPLGASWQPEEKAGSARQLASYLADLGVRPMEVGRVVRYGARQSLGSALEKVEWLRRTFQEASSPDFPCSGALERLLGCFDLIPGDEPLQSTFSFLQKLQAQKGGLAQLDSHLTAVPRLLESFPQILGPITARQLAETIEHMSEKWALSPKYAGTVVLCFPPVLFMSVERDLEPKKRVLKDYGLRVGDMGLMVAKFPWLLSSSVFRNLPLVRSFLAARNVPCKYVEKALRNFPTLLGCSPEKRFEPSLRYFAELGMSPENLACLLRQCAILLTKTPAQHETVTAYLVSLGVPRQRVLRVALSCTELFGYRKPVLEEKVRFLLELGLKRRLLSRVIMACPLILAYSPSVVRERLDFFMQRGLSRGEVLEMVEQYPQLFRYGVENVLRPKLDFLEQEMGRSLKEVQRYPKYVSFSLKDRIQKRYRLLKRRGVHLSLEDMLECGDRRFVETYLGFGQILLPLDELAHSSEGP